MSVNAESGGEESNNTDDVEEDMSLSGSQNDQNEIANQPAPMEANADIRPEVYDTDDEGEMNAIQYLVSSHASANFAARRDLGSILIPANVDNAADAEDNDSHIIFPPNEPNGTPRRRRLGNILIQAFRNPLRLTRQFRIHHHSRPVSEDEEDDEIMEEGSPTAIENFDTDLPAEHSYLGNMSRVSGVNYLEVGCIYHMLIFTHKYLLFPGETLPMILPSYLFDSNFNPEDEGLQFGLVFPSTADDHTLYGVSCQIFEKGTDGTSNNVILKSRAHQRFVVTRKDNANFEDIAPQFKTYAYVRILPEIYLPDPVSSLQLGSLNRFRGIPSMEDKLRSYQSSTSNIPKYIYEPYRMDKIIEKAKVSLKSYQIDSMPTDPILLSFWLARNLLFNVKDRYSVFLTNSVNIRMQIIDKSLDNEKFFCCTRCKSKIANCSSLFAMSKHGVQSNYINPGGCIHETNTVHNIIKDTVFPTGTPSTEFSWFPGYSWQIILCRLCDMHLGWKFAATKRNLLPKMFYGLSGSNLKVLATHEIAHPIVHTVTVSL